MIVLSKLDNRFGKLLLGQQLVDRQQLLETTREYKALPPAQRPKSLACYLVQQGLISRAQREQLEQTLAGAGKLNQLGRVVSQISGRLTRTAFDDERTDRKRQKKVEQEPGQREPTAGQPARGPKLNKLGEAVTHISGRLARSAVDDAKKERRGRRTQKKDPDAARKRSEQSAPQDEPDSDKTRDARRTDTRRKTRRRSTGARTATSREPRRARTTTSRKRSQSTAAVASGKGRTRPDSKGRRRATGEVAGRSSAEKRPFVPLVAAAGSIALICLCLLIYSMTDGDPEKNGEGQQTQATKSDQTRKPDQGATQSGTEKQPEDEEPPRSPAGNKSADDGQQTRKLAAQLEQTRSAVRAALARGELKSAIAAADRLRFKLVGLKASESLRESVGELRREIDAQAETVAARERKRFAQLLTSRSFDKAGELLERLRNGGHSQLEKTARELQTDLDLARESSLASRDQPTDPKPPESKPKAPEPKPKEANVPAGGDATDKIPLPQKLTLGGCTLHLPGGELFASAKQISTGDLESYAIDSKRWPSIRIGLSAATGKTAQGWFGTFSAAEAAQNYLRRYAKQIPAEYVGDGIHRMTDSTSLSYGMGIRYQRAGNNLYEWVQVWPSSDKQVFIIIIIRGLSTKDEAQVAALGLAISRRFEARKPPANPPKEANKPPATPPPKPATLVKKNGRTWTGTITKHPGGVYKPANYEFGLPPEMIAWYSEDPPKVVLRKWGKKLQAQRDATAEDWMTYAKFALYNHFKPSIIQHAMLRWQALRNKEGGDPWSVYFSRHYVVCGQRKQKKLKEYALRLELILMHYQKVLRSKRKPGLDFVVRFYDTRELYERESGMKGSNGMYSLERRELAILIDPASRRETTKMIFHEATHQYVIEYYKGYLSNVHWYEEGMAEYFSSARMESGRIIKVGDKMRVRLNLVKDMIRAGSLGTILKKIWRMERATFYDLTTIRDHYPLSWALVHFFKNTRNPYYARPWKRWMDEQTKRNLKTVDQLYEETLGKIDLDRLQKDLTAYVQKGL